jgi:hypothetical protein
MKDITDYSAGEKGISMIFSVLLFVVLLILVFFLAYLLYMNVPGSPQSLRVDTNPGSLPSGNEDFSLAEVRQFYSNMKFNHNKISYSIDSSCDSTKQERILSAFSEISNQVGLVSFYSNPENSDIDILCSISQKAIPGEVVGNSLDKQTYFVAGEGGAKEIIPSGKYNIITKGVVLLYGDAKNSLKCDKPNVEIHELMHVFGFNHSISKSSIMYPTLESCDQKIDDSIITELRRLYSEENLPDLYFENMSAVKKGRYLDFNFTVRNSGLIDASNVDYSIYDNGELVETRNIGNLRFGSGVIIQAQNLKLIHRDPSEIKFVIDNNNLIKELDKRNNVAVVKMS